MLFRSKCAAVALGLQSVFSKLRRDVLGCDISATLPGSPTFEQIMRQITNVPADVLAIDRLQRVEGCAR